MDALDSFTELAWRAQEHICADTAACDGLGTYEDVADATCASHTRMENRRAPRPRRRHRAMAGGRAFAAAFVDVFDSRGRSRRRGVRRSTNAGGAEEDDGRGGDPAGQVAGLGGRSGPDATRSRILTRLHKPTGSVSYKSDGAGVSVRLVPRCPSMPALNATYVSAGGKGLRHFLLKASFRGDNGMRTAAVVTAR
jgi:hypothetical protein